MSARFAALARRNRRQLLWLVQGVCALALISALAWRMPDLVLIGVGLVGAVGLFMATRRDEVTVLSVFLLCLFALPANLIVSQIGSAGTPAMLIAVGMFALWCLAKVAPGYLPTGRHPIRIVLFFYVLATLASYAAGYLRGLPADEASSADRALIYIAAIAGIVLFTSDTIRTREALDTLLQRLTVGGAFMSFVGLLQFLGTDLASLIQVPGLSVGTRDTTFTMARSSFERVAGTSLHPIEFAVVLAMLFPIAVHYALHAPRERLGQRWLVLALITMGIPLAISRSGIVTVLISGGAIALTWTIRRLGNALIIAVIGLIGMQALIPGLLNSIKNLFTSFNEDISIQGRTQDYDIVWRYFLERPLFGRGPGTFLPTRYIILDNDHLYVLVTMGLVGLLASVSMYITAAFLARGARKRSTDPETRHLGQALAGAILGAAVAGATFDSGGFQIMFATTYFLIGCCGAIWRLQLASAGPEISDPADQSIPRSIPDDATTPIAKVRDGRAELPRVP